MADRPGQILMARLNTKIHPTHSSKPKAPIATSKVARAKVAATQPSKAAKPAVPAARTKPERPAQKTQAELDEEMRQYERARRFAPA